MSNSNLISYNEGKLDVHNEAIKKWNNILEVINNSDKASEAFKNELIFIVNIATKYHKNSFDTIKSTLDKLNADT